MATYHWLCVCVLECALAAERPESVPTSVLVCHSQSSTLGPYGKDLMVFLKDGRGLSQNPALSCLAESRHSRRLPYPFLDPRSEVAGLIGKPVLATQIITLL